MCEHKNSVQPSRFSLRSLVYQSCLLPNLFAFWIMATVSVCAGLLLNQFRDQPLPLVYQSKQERLKQAVGRVGGGWMGDGESPRAGVSARAISLDEFRVFVKEKHGLVLDVRPEIFHRLGHVPGAFSLPREDFEKGYARLKSQLEANKNQPIVVYCRGDSCEDSELAQKALSSLGYTRVVVFRGGWTAWIHAGLPEEKTR